jgi:small subunit ribosomal protein S20
LAKRTASAQKQARKSAKRRQFYRGKRQALKSALKNLAAAKSKEEALKLLPEVQSLVDKSAKRRMVHPKTASRLKSRLAREAADLK